MALTPLMPTGQVEIDGQRYEARALDGHAEKGSARLKVVGAQKLFPHRHQIMNLTVSNIVFIIIGVGVLVVAVIIFSFFSVWLRASLAGAPVGMLNLLAMKLRQVPFSLIVDARVTARKAGIVIPIDDIEAHYLAGGNVVPTWCRRSSPPRRPSLSLDWRQACAPSISPPKVRVNRSWKRSALLSIPKSSIARTRKADAPRSTAWPRTASR